MYITIVCYSSFSIIRLPNLAPLRPPSMAPKLRNLNISQPTSPLETFLPPSPALFASLVGRNVSQSQCLLVGVQAAMSSFLGLRS